MMQRLSSILVSIAVAVHGEDFCCGVCLNTLAPATYDVSDWTACTTAAKPNPGCCFCDKVQTISLPGFKSTMKAGTTQFLTFPGVEKVTYSIINQGDEKKAYPRPKPSGTQFTKNSDGNYVVCLDTPGTLLFRGWGKEANNYPNDCTLMTVEAKITVTAGDAGATCEGSTAPNKTPAPAATGVDGKEVQCNAVRGSIVNGECVCLSDYSGPPDCTGSSSWKWIVSICGGIAAILSIGISVRQILLFRKKKAEERERDEAMSKFESVEVMNVSHAHEPDYYDADRGMEKPRRSPVPPRSPLPQRSPAGNRNAPQNHQPYPVAHPSNLSPRQSREYTL